MTQVFDDKGNVVPVTVLEAGPVTVTYIKTKAKDGYNAVQVGYGTKKEKNISKAVKGHVKDLGNFRFIKEFRIEATPPGWSIEFDLWAKEVLERGAIDELMNYKALAPGLPYAHPTVEHFAPIFITLGAAEVADAAPKMAIEGYWMGLSKRSFQVA